MKQRLMLLNILLLLAVVGAAMHLRGLIVEADKRHAIVLDKYPLPPAPARPAPLPMVGVVAPEAYGEAIQRLVMARDRNPIPEPPPPPPPEKEIPLKPMPTLPLAYGVLSIGDTPLAMLSEKRGSPQKGYRVGDQVGEFKLLGFNNTQIQFEWEGKIVTRTMDELRDKQGPVVEQAVAAAAPPAASNSSSVIGAGEKKPEAPVSSGEPTTQATVQGDTVKFVRPGPFGNYTWTKSKAELNDAEKAMIDGPKKPAPGK